MTKILIYAMNYAPELLGVGRYTGEIGAHLAAEGNDVTVLTTVPHYPEWRRPSRYGAASYAVERQDGVTVFRCPLVLRRPMRGLWRLLAPLSFALFSAPLLIWLMLTRRPQVVFCVEPTLMAAPLALLLGALVGARTVLHVQDLEIEAGFAAGHLRGGAAKRAAMRWEAFVLRRFGQVITISEKMREKVLTKGVRPERLSLIRNWVDLGRFRAPTGRNRYRDELNLGDTRLVALYAGSIGAKQALGVVLDAAERLARSPAADSLTFVIAGDGPAKEALVARYGALGNVTFLPPQPEERMADLLTLADVHLLPQSAGITDLVLPSKLGGMLASGRPVLVTADRGSELFAMLDGTAIIVPAGNSGAVADELAVLARHGGHHPAARDGRSLAMTLSRDLCMPRIARLLEPERPVVVAARSTVA